MDGPGVFAETGHPGSHKRPPDRGADRDVAVGRRQRPLCLGEQPGLFRGRGGGGLLDEEIGLLEDLAKELQPAPEEAQAAAA